jgi:phosphatidylserine/phosphatidylglycerophosphate/cardiolipin synthase-like enzyme
MHPPRFGSLRVFLLVLVLFSGSGCHSTQEVGKTNGPLPVITPSAAVDAPEGSLTAISLPSGFGARNSWVEIYFTDPGNPLSSQETGGVDEVLVSAIDSARLSIDLAVYSMSLRNVRDALVRAHRRGIVVRVVTESDNQDSSAIQALQEAGIPLLGDRREGLMHDKFMVIDRSEVWLGSMNYTYSGVYADDNALVHVRSKELADNYLSEFNEMFVDDLFGPQVVPNPLNPEIRLEGTRLEVLFSPDDGVSDHLVSILENAQESIYFMAFSFTSDELGEVIRSRSRRGVEVAGVMDADQIKFNIGTEYDLFMQDGMNVYLDGIPGQMHHKIMIVDESIVIVGSYNFTQSAETRNDENVIIMYDEDIADFFIQEFRRVYQQAQR